jgi:serine/threonine protein kinase
MAEDPLELIGITLDERFRVDSVVGEGELSVAYRGQDLETQAPILIRCLNLPNTLDPALTGPFVDSFRERTRLHRRLAPGSASFVQVLGDGDTVSLTTGQTVPYEIREWLDATPFVAYCAQRRADKTSAWSLDEVLTLLAPVADGLAYVHDMGTTHGELNPTHLLVVEAEGRTTIKIVDFGEGRAPEKGDHKPVLRLLLPDYAAPEQVDKQLGPMGPWTDVFSLAVIIVECLAGGLDTEKVAASVVIDPKNRPTPRKLGLKLSAPVDELLERALSLEPAQRPPDAAAFWQGLKAAAAPPPEPGHVKPTSLPPQTKSTKPAKPTKPPIPIRPSPPMAPNPFAKATLIGFSPPTPASVPPPPPPPPPSEFGENEAATKRQDGLSEPPMPSLSLQPSAMPPPVRAHLPLDGTAPSNVEEPEVFLPALMGPSLLTRLRDAAVFAWTFSRAWARGKAWPWLVSRAHDKNPPARAAFGGSVLGGVVLLTLFVRLCSGGRATKATIAAVPTSGTTVTSLPNLPAPMPAPSAAPIEPTQAMELPAEAPPSAPSAPPVTAPFTRAAASAALDMAGADLSDCKQLGTIRGPGSIRASFGKSGTVAHITMGPPYADTPEGICILDRFGRAEMTAIHGAPGSVNYTFNLPK